MLPSVSEHGHNTDTSRFIDRPSSSLLIPIMNSQPNSRSSSPAPGTSRLPIDPTLNGGITHHRPPFVHASTSVNVPSLISTPPYSSSSHAEYSFPAEKELPPYYSQPGDDHPPHRQAHLYNSHLPHSQSSNHAFAHASRASSRRSSVVPVVPDPCMMSKIRDKILGKEGGMGRALVIGWVITTLGFVIATAFWKGELFGALDRLSKNLLAMGLQGKLIFTLLIFTTTIPPLPLYSTLMVLSGYTFGVCEGFVVSYIASLSGAVVVFVVSRTLLRDVITKSLSNSPTAQSLLAIIPANPHLLLLIRIAPYPYNLLNVILASAPSLSLRTYTACTAVSLLKLVLHTWIGSGIHDIASFGRGPRQPASGDGGPGWEGAGDRPWRPPHGPNGSDGNHRGGHGHGPGYGGPGWREDQIHRNQVRMYSTWIGIGLCVALFFYLTHLAKKALRKAQEEEALKREEEMILLSGSDED